MLTTAKLKARREVARKEYDSFAPLRDEAYRYAIPFRRSIRDRSTGEAYVDQAFDHTAIDASFRFAGKLQQDLMPAGNDNFKLEPGPMVIDAGQRAQLMRELAPISKVVSAFFEDPDWVTAFHEMALDLSAGTGAILMNGTDEPDKLWDPFSVPIEEVMLESGVNGRITGIFWTRKMSKRVLLETWPEGTFGEEITKLKDSDELDVHCDTVWDRSARRWRMIIWCEKQEARIFASESRTCPWLLPRYFRVAGESYGRGLAMLAMPSIKTVNTAARLHLQAAAIAMLGIYTAVDDGVFNPDLSPVEPGIFWKVARNAGNQGPSVQKFADPRLDLTQLVMQDLRGSVKSTMMDDDLPMTGEAVKTPTEIIERVRKSAANHIGAFGRLIKEIIEPAVKRCLELAYDRGLIRGRVNIDQLLVRIKVTSPMAIARAAERVQKNMQWLEMVIAVESSKAAAPGLARIAETDALLEEAGRDLGVEERFITSPDRRAEIDKAMAEQQQAQALLAAAGGKMPAAA